MNDNNSTKPIWLFTGGLALLMFTLLAAFCKPASAGEVIAMGYSYHLDREKEYNEVHNTFGATFNGYTLMYYKNSGGHDSILFGYDVLPWQIGGIQLGFTPVAVTAYLDGGEPAPMVFGTLKGRIDGCWGYRLQSVVAVTKIMFTCDFGETSIDRWSTSGQTNWAAGYGYGLLGGAPTIYYKITDHLTARASFTTSKHGWDDRWDHWEDGAWLYQQEHLRPRFYGLNIDYAPFKGDFIIYGGLGINDTTYDTTYHAYTDQGGNTCGEVRIAHTDATVCHGDKLYGHVEWGKLTGSSGIRWGNPFTGSGWDWYVDLGVQTMDGITCKAEYDGRGDVTDSQLRAFENKECAKYDDLVQWVPRLEAGLVWRF